MNFNEKFQNTQKLLDWHIEKKLVSSFEKTGIAKLRCVTFANFFGFSDHQDSNAGTDLIIFLTQELLAVETKTFVEKIKSNL